MLRLVKKDLSIEILLWRRMLDSHYRPVAHTNTDFVLKRNAFYAISLRQVSRFRPQVDEIEETKDQHSTSKQDHETCDREIAW
ncbi:MAG: hypothetical protein RIS08_104 [Actinomycetota bacterium]